ncbi:bifunctional helix-turn-helix transcriptional regulator/GNAT family N-acetyltransferase [Spirosoma montaniterrae]|uniref:MarR family transcriptional regulator n=1 Tax=Spirosoma montaniterrae TaxID=1178516 RepID=A0A1P9WYU5_9BACT|nr:bifunctional helix-turn-helix transcriptional regulator/GNAT family N-acetyltransferase [Spirosoma montaniterrae]AQG80488.1 MarR family transcriptional regulator [Spirosoma montaniterrae]
MPTIYDELGRIALGSRIRRLGDRMTDENSAVYALYGSTLEPRWFPVFYALMQQDGQTTTGLAERIGQTHASVSQVVKEMQRNGLVTVIKQPGDARCSHLSLTDAGRALIPALNEQLTDLDAAMQKLQAESQYNLLEALTEFEFLLDQRSLRDRIQAERKQREGEQVEIVEYTPAYHDAFRQLNYAWIEQYFTVEAEDRKALDFPDEKILKPGGQILMALYQGEPVGTCALIPMPNGEYELAKMAVSPTVQGRSIGYRLGMAALQRARDLGAPGVYLESNTKLTPAINLYHKLGFKKVVGPPSPYERSNIQMRVDL